MSRTPPDDGHCLDIAPHGAMQWEDWHVVVEEEGKKVNMVTDAWVDRSVLLGKAQKCVYTTLYTYDAY